MIFINGKGIQLYSFSVYFFTFFSLSLKYNIPDELGCLNERVKNAGQGKNKNQQFIQTDI